MIENCVFAINAMANKGSFNPINLGEGVNTSNPEYFPSVTADDSTLLFTRMIEDKELLWEQDKKIYLFQKMEW